MAASASAARQWRVVVVTGASRGIGQLIAEDLASDSDVVVLSARDTAGLQSSAARVSARGARPVVVAGDITDRAHHVALVSAARASGPVDVLVNNAGVEVCVEVAQQTPEEIERQIQVNLTAPVLLTRAFLDGMLAARRGAVVMMSSLSGKSPTPYNAVYAGTKFGLNGFTASLQIELHGTGVTAGVVCPGFVRDTGMWAHTPVSAPALMPDVPAAAVVHAVRRVVGGAPDVIVTATPVRPALALGQLFPSLARPALRLFGVLDVLKRRADVDLRHRAAGHDLPAR